MPKLKGFSNARFKVEYSVVNVAQLQLLADKGVTEINKATLLEHGVVRNKNHQVKVL